VPVFCASHVIRAIRGSKQPRQLGYFPEEAVARIEQIQQWKRDGLSMDELYLNTGLNEGQEWLEPSRRRPRSNSRS
jgi:hypothetical protein